MYYEVASASMSCDILVQNFQLSSFLSAESRTATKSGKLRSDTKLSSEVSEWPGTPGVGHHHPGHIGQPWPAGLTYTQLIRGKNP